MTDSAWAYLMMGAFCLGVDHGMEPSERASLRGTAWQASLLLLWPAVLALGDLQCGPVSSPQENAKAAWQKLAKKMGFKWDTVKPSRPGDQRFFYAEPDK